MKQEDVMVVETERLAPFITGRDRALILDGTDEILRIFSEEHFFVPRAEAENEPRWRQIIPYVLITHDHSVYTLQRTSKQSEQRLHHKMSIGIGGHINPGHDLMAGLRQELDEEVQIDDPWEIEFRGIINEAITEVGRVHIGACFVLRASTRNVRVLEVEKMTGSWRTLGELQEVYPQLESWSQIAYDALLRTSGE